MLKKNKRFWPLLFLALIFLLSLILRLYQLSEMPPALNWDEVSHGYNAESILKTGQDEWGQTFPLANFRAYGDYPLPLNLYLTIPSIFLFGLSELAIRLPHALLGGLTVLVTFWLVQGLGLSVGVGLLTALLVAVSPWTLFTSRFVLQSNLSVFLVTLGLGLFFHRRQKACYLPLSALSLGLSAYAYHNARIVTPLLVLALIWLYRREWRQWWIKKRKTLLLAIIFLLVFFLPLIPILANPEARARASWVSIIDQGAINEIIENRLNSSWPAWSSRFLYNRPVYFLKHFTVNYLGYFSPFFLFFEGGSQYQFSVPGWGLLPTASLPFFYLGLAWLSFWALMKKKNWALAIFAWLLLAPIPAAMTRGSGHVIRATTLLPLPFLLTGLGFWQTVLFVNRRIKKTGSFLLVIFLTAILLSTVFYWQVYFGSYRQDYAWSWQYGYKQATTFIKDHYQDYDQIFITKKYGEPHEFLLFYLNWDPAEYRQGSQLVRYWRSDWYWVDAFDKFRFINDWEIKEKTDPQNLPLGRHLLITSPGNYLPGWHKIETVNFPDNQPAFEILER